jgi:hypothetical protein
VRQKIKVSTNKNYFWSMFMLDKQLFFNIFANTGNLEAYLLYTELKDKEKNKIEASIDLICFKDQEENILI